MPDFALPADALEKITSELRTIEVPDEPFGPGPGDEGGQGTEDLGASQGGAATGEGGGEPSPAAPPAEPPTRTLSDDEWSAWETYRALDQRLQSDPAFAERFRGLLVPEPPSAAGPPPATATEAPPDSYLASDPAFRQVMATVEAVRAEQFRQAQLLNAQRQAETQATMNAVSSGFKARHSLDDAAFARVYEQAGNYAGVLPALAQRGVALDQAIDQVLEAAFWSMPEMREAEAARLAAAAKASGAKKAKASSLSGSSGSAPRTAPAPMNAAERRDAMIRALSEGIAGGFTE